MKSGRYYQTRVGKQPPDYEGAYWHVVKDPDGRERNRLEERDLHLSDLAEELAFVRTLSPGRVLDVGCGLGFFLSGLDPAWERHGVELSAFAAEHASQVAQVHVGTLDSAGYPDQHFDLVIAHHVIEHVADPGALLLEMRANYDLDPAGPDARGLADRWDALTARTMRAYESAPELVEALRANYAKGAFEGNAIAPQAADFAFLERVRAARG